MAVLQKSLTPLDMFLLVFVKVGLATPYDLLSKIGMGVGTSSPALKRLEENGLLTCALGPRNRTRFAMTEKAEKQLKRSLDEGPRQYWSHRGRDTFDSLRRAIFLAWARSRPDEARHCVYQSINDLVELSEKSERSAADFRKTALRLRGRMLEEENPGDRSHLIATVYCLIGAEMDAALFKLQAAALENLNLMVGDLPQAPKIWSDKSLPSQSSMEAIRTSRLSKGV